MRQIRFLSVVSTIVLFLLSCSPEEPDSISVDDFMEILEQSISSDNLSSDRISGLDPYESYFIARKAETCGYQDVSIALAEHCMKNSRGFIGARAAELLIRIYTDNGDYKDAEFTASLASAEYPDNYSFKRAVVEAEYRQQEDSAVIDGINALRVFDEADTDYELALFKAVAAFRLGLPDWKISWIELFTEVPASEFILRGWDYLSDKIYEPTSEFPGYENLVKGKYLYSTGKKRESVEYFRAYAENITSVEITEAVIGDIENAFVGTGQTLRGAVLFDEMGRQSGDLRCLFAAARLYRRSGKYPEAEKCMEAVLAGFNQGEIPDRELWYSLDIRIRRNLSDALNALDFYIEQWTEPEFFSDSLDNLCTGLVRRRRWNDVARLAAALEHNGPDGVYDRCRYISERAAESGYLPEQEFSAPYSDLYYRILSGDELEEFGDPEAVIIAEYKPRNEAELYIKKLIDYEVGNILDEVKLYQKSLSEEFLVYCAENISGYGKALDSIRIMYQYQGDYSAVGLGAVYPDLYRQEIESAAEQNGIPVQIMLALVWKESGFEREIVSRSGAVGLSQLMPSTADDVARRIGTSVSDLSDPYENLSLGSWYLAWLKGYVGNTASAVLSYNGGPGRVKGWMKQYGDLPDDLFYEIIPVPETHQYGKKVLTASVLYGLLYYGIEPQQTLKLFFTENN